MDPDSNPKQKRVRGVSTCKKKCKDEIFNIEFNANHLPIGRSASKFSSWSVRQVCAYRKLIGHDTCLSDHNNVHGSLTNVGGA